MVTDQPLETILSTMEPASLIQDEQAKMHIAKEADAHTRDWRRTTLVVLVHHFCVEHGLSDTAATLREEARIKINDFSVCDNVDLESILTDYEAFYLHKFRKKVKLIRYQPSSLSPSLVGAGHTTALSNLGANPRLNNPSSKGSGHSKILARVRSKSARPRVSPAPGIVPYSSQSCGKPEVTLGNQGHSRPEITRTSSKQSTPLAANEKPKVTDNPSLYRNFRIVGTNATFNSGADAFPDGNPNRATVNFPPPTKDPLPLCAIGNYSNNLSNHTDEWRELSRQIAQDIVVHNLGVSLDDIVGMVEAKKIIQEAIIYPRKYPDMFSAGQNGGIGRHFEPWRGLLLHGPPGTGKTMLAKAISTECRMPFFNVTISTIVSKWRGDSEKAIRVLFDMARMMAPSIVFIDEIDALGGRRSSGCEHEASRRMKTELLVQLDGLLHQSPVWSSTKPVNSFKCDTDDDLDVIGTKGGFEASNEMTWSSGKHVFVLAASNMPWDIDPALLRRLEKHIFINLPDVAERAMMVRKYYGIPELPEATNIRRGLERGQNVAEDFDPYKIAEATEGFSGSEIHLACKEASMSKIREAVARLEDEKQGIDQHKNISFRKGASGHHQVSKLKPVTTDAVLNAILEIRSSAKSMRAQRVSSWGAKDE